MQISQVMTPYMYMYSTLSQTLIKYMYDQKRYLSQFVSEMFDSLQQDSASQYELDSSVTMATYWVSDPHRTVARKGFSGHLSRSILIFANGAS